MNVAYTPFPGRLFISLNCAFFARKEENNYLKLYTLNVRVNVKISQVNICTIHFSVIYSLRDVRDVSEQTVQQIRPKENKYPHVLFNCIGVGFYHTLEMHAFAPYSNRLKVFSVYLHLELPSD